MSTVIANQICIINVLALLAYTSKCFTVTQITTFLTTFMKYSASGNIFFVLQYNNIMSQMLSMLFHFHVVCWSNVTKINTIYLN